MSMDLTGITNKNEYFTNHYFSTVFEDSANATISGWNAEARESEEIRTPWSLLRQNARQYYTAHDKFVRSSANMQVLANIRTLADNYLKSLGYPEAKPEVITVDDGLWIANAQITQSKTSGVEEITIASPVKFIDGNIIVEGAQSDINVYNLAGAVVATASAQEGSTIIDASSLGSGIYLVRIADKAYKIRK